MARNRHVANERTAFDDGDASFAELPIAAAVVDKWRDIEFRIGLLAQIGVDNRGVFELYQAHSGLRPGRPRDDRKAAAVENGFDRNLTGGNASKRRAIDAHVHRDDDIGRGF